MLTAIIGIGNIGSRVARDLVAGGERVVLASNDLAAAQSLAKDLGERASAATSADAITEASAVVFAVYFDVIKDLITEHSASLGGKVVIDPSNPLAPDGKGGFKKAIPEDQSSGEIIAGMLPSDVHFVKAFGTLPADKLDTWARQTPRAVLFYATEDARAEAIVRELITAAGFDPVKAGGVKASIRIEVFGDLHPLGGLNGKSVTEREARDLVAAAAPS